MLGDDVPDVEPVVTTVLGDVPATQIGVTLMHEHIFMVNADVRASYPGRWDEEAGVQQASDDLRAVGECGVDTVVDLTAMGLGRDPMRLHRVAQQVDVHIVAAAGLYSFHDIPSTFRLQGPGCLIDGEEELVDLFVNDIEVGIGKSGVRAGILKCATDRIGVTVEVDRVVRAVARAAIRTGRSVSTHAHAGTKQGIAQQRIFASEGVDPGRVVIGHCGDSTDLEYLTKLIENGSYVGMDRFGMDPLLPLEERINVVVELCHRGFAGRMVLSHDANCSNDWRNSEELLRRMPHWNMTTISRVVVPALRARGVGEEDLYAMLVANPRTILSTPAQPPLPDTQRC